MTLTLAEALRSAAERLSATSDTARLDAELLAAHSLGVSRSEMLLRHMHDPAPPSFAQLVDRRAEREPVALITGVQEFYGLELAVTGDTLVPRADSETLIEAARERFAAEHPRRILDLGTGSGALLLAALSLFPAAEGVGIDASAAAVGVAASNALRLGFEGRTRILERDWTAREWSQGLGRFDLVLCNPPYVEQDAALEPEVRDHEPAAALFAGKEGLDAYRTLVPQLGKLISTGGVAILEIGSTQDGAVMGIARESGLSVALRRDLAGRPRALICT